MTHREEFERARAAGLRQRQALRMARALQRQADIPCAGLRCHRTGVRDQALARCSHLLRRLPAHTEEA